MLTPELIQKIKKIHIKTGRLVNTMMAGQYKSVFRGTGIEFEEVREYTPGDEVKSIDWKVSARMGRPYIKRFREERELVVMLLVDMSASAGFGTTDYLKREIAVETAGIMAFNAIRNNDKVGAILFTDQVEKYIPPKKGSAHVWRVIKEIFDFTPKHTGTAIETAIGYLGRVCRKKAVVFLISDFLDQGYVRSLRITSQKHELIAVLLSDPGDFKLPEAGIFQIQDFETNSRMLLDASHPSTRKWYEKRQQGLYTQTLDTFKTADIDCIQIPTDQSVADALTRYFRLREKRMRG